MGAFPSTQATKNNLDQATDDPSQARAELAALVDKVNAIILSYAAASGLCDLDTGGKIPLDRLPMGAGAGIDADLVDGKQTSAAVAADTIPVRGAGGQIKAGAPVAADDVARKDTVDSHTTRTDNPHGVTLAQVGAAPAIHSHSYAAAVTVYCTATSGFNDGGYVDLIVRRSGTYGTMYVDAYDNYLNYTDSGG